MAKIVSANRLTDGVVVYRTAAGQWAPDIAAAAVLAPADAGASLADARQDEARNLIVDAVLVDTEAGAGGVRAATLRERIRASGPSVAYCPATAGSR